MKNLFFYSFLLFFSAIFAQSKWNIGLVAGGSSKLRMGIPHKETYTYPSGYSSTSIDIYPFEVFLNGGISATYRLSEKHFLQADLMLHRMDISNKYFYAVKGFEALDNWETNHTRYRFFQMPITYNWVWNQKKLRPFVGVGIAPSYIFLAENTMILSYPSVPQIQNTNRYSIIEEHELQRIRRIKMPMTCEIGFQPLPHTVISLRSSLGVYLRYVGHHSYYLGKDVYAHSQNTNMFSLIAKVYLGK